MTSPAARQGAGRLVFLAVGMVAFASLVLQRLYWYQVADQARLTAVATAEHEQEKTLPSRRGAIVDTNGYPLAVSVTYHTVYGYGPLVRDLDRTAGLLADALQLEKAAVARRLREADQHWTPIAERAPANTVVRLQALALDGIELRPVTVREYPEGSVAAPIIGFIGMDGYGLSGLELSMDQELRGEPGRLISERDADGQEIGFGRKRLEPPLQGSDVVLTIDRHVQRVAERVLADSIRQNEASGGTILITEPRTGALLAVASQPTFALSRDLEVDPKRQHLYKPSVVTDTYEPGSVMKLITVAGALEEQVVGPESRYFDSGLVEVGGARVQNWDGQGYGTVTVRQILTYSLNTGAQWVAGLLGPEKFYRYLGAFGFGTPTGVPLSGEAAGWFRTPGEGAWSRADLATNSFGQGVAATPLQVIAAVSALGNEGVLMRPRLVREVRGPSGGRPVQPEPVRQVVSAPTAAAMLDLMVSVWSQPALQAYRIPGYTLAGKSGTADIPGPAGYNLGGTYGSYVAIGPIPNPRFAILVRIDRPATIWGGQAATPAVRALAEELFDYWAIPPNRGTSP